MDIPRKPSGLSWLWIFNLEGFPEAQLALGSAYKWEYNICGLGFFEVWMSQGQLRCTPNRARSPDSFQWTSDVLEPFLTTKSVSKWEQRRRAESPPRHFTSLSPETLEWLLAFCGVSSGHLLNLQSERACYVPYGKGPHIHIDIHVYNRHTHTYIYMTGLLDFWRWEIQTYVRAHCPSLVFCCICLILSISKAYI